MLAKLYQLSSNARRLFFIDVLIILFQEVSHCILMAYKLLLFQLYVLRHLDEEVCGEEHLVEVAHDHQVLSEDAGVDVRDHHLHAARDQHCGGHAPVGHGVHSPHPALLHCL